MHDRHGLEWVFTSPSTTCNFINLTSSISNKRINTTIYKKKQNLYLYIPPHSAHPPDIVNALFFGHILCLRRLCSHKRDIQQKAQDFLNHLIQCDHPISKLLLIFKRAHQ
ncbi:hypothetical protein ACHAW6_000342 [Cyclotella cf. meneghiniana]